MSNSSAIDLHGIGECNKNGIRLFYFSDFGASNQLLITNTWFQHKSLHQATWYHNGNCSRPCHMMDFVVNTLFYSSVLDIKVFFSTYHVSDHEMVVSTIRFRVKA